MGDKWLELLEYRWKEAAGELMASGWERHGHKYHQAVFTRNDESVILGRQLGSTDWYTIPIAVGQYCSDREAIIRLMRTLEIAHDELIRLRRIHLPRYEGKAGEPDIDRIHLTLEEIEKARVYLYGED